MNGSSRRPFRQTPLYPKIRIDILKYTVSKVVIRPPLTPVNTSGMHKELPCRIYAYFLSAVASDPIRSTIIPLTVEALEIVLADLKGGRGQGMRLTLPNHGFLPFISVPHETSAKMIRTYTGRAIDPQALENEESN